MKPSIHRHTGFTLIELLVASMLLVLLLLVIVGVIDSTSKLTYSSHQRIGADSGGRQALDRIGADWARAIFRPDLPDLIEKLSGNDRITFFVYADGHFDPPLGTNGDARGVSKVSYQASTNILLRGAEGTRWGGPADTLLFSSGTVNPAADANSEVASYNVFRFETAFLLKNGDIVAKIPPPKEANAENGDDGAGAPGFHPQNETNPVRALIVGVAALDSRVQASLDEGDLDDLAQRFPDAEKDKDILSVWKGALEGSSIPRRAANAVRVYQRYYYLEQ